MRPALALVLAGLAGLSPGLAGCGDDLAPPVPGDLLAQLEALPGVTAVEQATDTTGYAYVVLRFTQPVDHADPAGPTFEQRVSLLHVDPAAPMVVQTSGYWDYYQDNLVELTRLLAGNQISIEHRYFGESRPSPADWSKLTIEQMATDQHVIITALRTIYGGAFITTGGSKGGMTAIYHRRFFPDDVDGTVPYVAPLSLGAPDARYAAFLDTLGPDACRQAVRDVAVELLARRRAMVEARTTAQATTEGHAYTRVAIGPVVESAIVSLEWAFWQYYGVSACAQVPAPIASDDVLWTFLDRISPPSDSDDAQIDAFDAYYHQAYAQLGYPDGGAVYLDPYLMYADADYIGTLPTAQPAYDDGAAMRDIDAWVQGEGDRLLFVYGEWDPWTGGMFDLGGATDSLRLVEPEGSHGSRIARLSAADESAAIDRLAAWTGVTPLQLQARARVSGLAAPAERREPRVPPVFRLRR